MTSSSNLRILERIKPMMFWWLVHTIFLCKPNRKINNETHSLKYNESNFKKVTLFLKTAIHRCILESLHRQVQTESWPPNLCIHYTWKGYKESCGEASEDRWSGRIDHRGMTGGLTRRFWLTAFWRGDVSQQHTSSFIGSEERLMIKSMKVGTKNLMHSDHMASLSLM